MTATQRKICHPDLHNYFGRSLSFLAVITSAYREELKDELRTKFTYLNIYELNAKEDLLLRVYSTSEILDELKKYLERTSLGEVLNFFTVDRIYRIWGFDVTTKLTINPPGFDLRNLKRCIDDYPHLLPDPPDFILGERKLPDPEDIRAFITVLLENPPPGVLERLIDKIRSNDILKSPVIGIYRGTPGTHLIGQVLLEVTVNRYKDIRRVVKKTIYELASPMTIKTTTMLVDDMYELGDLLDFEETEELLLKTYRARFLKLRTVPPAAAFGKIHFLEPLRPWWGSPPPIGGWIAQISDAIIDDNADGLRGPVSSIAVVLEAKALKAVLIPWVQHEFSNEWQSRSMNEFKLEAELPHSTLGQLIHAAIQMRDKVKLRVPLLILEQFNAVRVSVLHDKAPNDSRQYLSFDEIQRILPKVLAQVLTEAPDLFYTAGSRV